MLGCKYTLTQLFQPCFYVRNTAWVIGNTLNIWCSSSTFSFFFLVVMINRYTQLLSYLRSQNVCLLLERMNFQNWISKRLLNKLEQARPEISRQGINSFYGINFKLNFFASNGVELCEVFDMEWFHFVFWFCPFNDEITLLKLVAKAGFDKTWHCINTTLHSWQI